MEKIFSYAFTGTIAVMLWNLILYLIKRSHSKKDKKNDEIKVQLNAVLIKTIDIRTEIQNHLNDIQKDMITVFRELSFTFKNIFDLVPKLSQIMEKVDLESKEYSKNEVTKNRENVNDYLKLTATKIRELTKSIDLNINDLNSINLSSLNISKKIIEKKTKLTQLIKTNQFLLAYENDTNIGLEEFVKIINCTHELEKEIHNELKKL